MKKKLTLALAWLLVLVLTIFAFIFSGYIKNPFVSALDMKSPSLTAADSSGNKYIIDSSLMRIIRLNADNEVTLTLAGGQSGNGFFYAENIAADADGNIYLSDTILGDDQTTVRKERIVQYAPDGRFAHVIYETAYEAGRSPKMYGGISGLQFLNGRLYWTLKDENSVSAYSYAPGGAAEELFRFDYNEARVYFEDVRLTGDLSGLILTRKDGGIWLSDAQGLTTQVYAGHDGANGDDWSLPFEAAQTADGGIVFTDTACREVKYLSPEQVALAQSGAIQYQAQTLLTRRGGDDSAIGSSPIYTRLNVSDDYICLTDTFSAVFAAHSGEVMSDISSAPVANELRIKYALAWLNLAAIVILAVLLLKFMLHGRKHNALSPLFKKGMLIALVTLIAAALVSSIIIGNSRSQLNSEVLQSIATITQMASDFIDGDSLEKLNSISSFHNDDYNTLKSQLDAIMERSFEWGANPYYLIYMTDGDTVYRVMDYIDSVSCYAPMDTAYPGSYYQEVMETGELQVYDSVADSTGIWTLAVGPIYNSAGKPIAVIEIGRNLHALTVQQNALVQEIVRNVLAMVITLLMIYTELLFVAEMCNKQRKLRALPAAERYLGIEVVRPLVFLLLIADYMQNGFEPIYVSQLYTGLWGLPESIGIAIPLTSEVIATALSAVAAGYLRDKLGIRRMLTFGVALASCGIITRGLASDIPLFIVGKLITGMGMGGVFVALNTFIAERSDAEDVNRGYAAYFAASLAAINVGIVIGSYIAEITGYKYVYIISGILLIILGLGTLLMLRGNFEPAHRLAKMPREKSRIGFLRFFFDRKVFALQILMFIPYLIMSYFLYYFYPLYAAEIGISDAAIGQTFLINGLCVTYLGPLITPQLLRALGARLSCALGAGLYVAGILLFALNPSIISALGCILLMGIADSFTFSAMTTFFTSAPAVTLYGESKASGIKSTTENTGYTLAPFAYGAALMLGTGTGLIAMAAIFTGLTIAFLLLSVGRQKPIKKDENSVCE